MTEEETVEEPEPRQAELIGEIAANREQTPVREGQLRTPRRWEQLLVESAVIGSRDRWRRRLDGLANELRAELAELSDDDEIEAAAVMRTLDDLAAFTAYALPLVDLLDGWPDSANWGEWLDQLGDLAARALKRPDRVLPVLAELAPIAPVGPLSLSEVIDVLGPLLLERAVPPPPHRYGKVFVGPVEAARGLSFDAVFVPGLAERMFPRKIVEEPILLDRVREQISGVQRPTRAGLRTSAWHLRLRSVPLKPGSVFLTRASTSRPSRAPAFPPSTRWKPCELPKGDCLILASSPDAPKPRPLPASAGPHLPILSRRSTAPSMIFRSLTG